MLSIKTIDSLESEYPFRKMIYEGDTIKNSLEKEELTSFCTPGLKKMKSQKLEFKKLLKLT